MSFSCAPTMGKCPCAASTAWDFFYHDCRFLNGYEVKLNDQPLTVLGSPPTRGFMSVLELTNPDLDGVPKASLGLHWEPY